MSGNAAFPGFSESPQFSIHRFAAGKSVSLDDRIPIHRKVASLTPIDASTSIVRGAWLIDSIWSGTTREHLRS